MHLGRLNLFDENRNLYYAYTSTYAKLDPNVIVKDFKYVLDGSECNSFQLEFSLGTDLDFVSEIAKSDNLIVFHQYDNYDWSAEPLTKDEFVMAMEYLLGDS